MGSGYLTTQLPCKSTAINPATIMEDFISMIPPGFLPKQFMQDVKESETTRAEPQQLHDFLLLLAMFLNDFCNATAQFTYGVDDLLDGGKCSDERKKTLLTQKVQLTQANDYIQTFCNILHTGKLLHPKILLHVIQKYIPQGLMSETGDQTTDVVKVLDTLQDHLLDAIPETQKYTNARLSNLWTHFNKESGSLIEVEVVHGLWKSLYRTIHYAHSIGDTGTVQGDKAAECHVEDSDPSKDLQAQGDKHRKCENHIMEPLTTGNLSVRCDTATEDGPASVSPQEGVSTAGPFGR